MTPPRGTPDTVGVPRLVCHKRPAFCYPRSTIAVVLMLTALAGVLLCSLAACGTAESSDGSPTPSRTDMVYLTGDNFVQHAVTIRQGMPLRFDDTNGVLHQLCLGEDMRCVSDVHAASDAP